MTLVSNGLNNNTKPYTWTFADATARTSATGFVAADVGSWAVQLSDGTIWELTATTPTWAQRAGAAGMTNPMTTAGDIIIGGAAGAAQRLGIGTTGQVLTVVSGAPAWATGGGGGGAPTSAKYVTTASDATLTAEVAIPGLGASADRLGAYGSTIVEDYETTTPGLTWTPSSPATVDSNTTFPSHLYVQTTDTTVRLGLRAFSPAADFDVRGHVSLGLRSGGDCAIGLIVTDASGNNVFVVMLNARLDQTFQIASNYNSAFATAMAIRDAGQTSRIYLRITRVGSVYTGYVSDDGLIWSRAGTTASATGTVAQVGYRFYNLSAGDGRFAADWLRATG